MSNERPDQTRRRRAVESDYLVALADVVPLEVWQKICLATVEAAKAGDAKARDWLSRFLLSDKPPRLLDVTVGELAAGPDAELIKRVAQQLEDNTEDEMFHRNELKQARRLLNGES